MLFGAATGKKSGDRGRCRRDPEARSFVHTEVEKKKLNSSRVCLVKGNEQRARSQSCVKGLSLKGGYLAFLVALLANFTNWSCRKLLIFFSSSQRSAY